MKGLRLLGLLVLSTIVGSSSAQIGKKLVGNNVYTTISNKVADFSELVLNVDAVVEYVQNADSAGRVEIYAEENIVYQVELVQKKNTLTIDYLSQMLKMEYGTIRVKLFSSALSKAEINGAGIVRLLQPHTAEKFSTIVSGNGQFLLNELNAKEYIASIVTGSGDIYVKAGTVEKANYRVLGNGEIRNEGLQCKAVKSSINGGGSVRCWAVETLNSSIIGSGTVRYVGEPTIKSNTIGSGLMMKYVAPEQKK